jgi:hypothetical protein
MKNIHLITTDKPSRLCINGKNGQHIYIINNEEIKEEDYRLNIQRGYFKKADKEGLKYYNKQNSVFKKIILTTDQDLIKDGVQPIGDEFLEWFVKNPSCEFADINDWMSTNGTIAFGGDKRYQLCNHLHNKIIIPKEEPIPVWKQIIETCGGEEEFMKSAGLLPKQKTLEEAAEHYQLNDNKIHHNIQYRAFRDGAKWQQEQILQFLYSEIIERRPYSSSKMCEVVIEFIEQLNTKK